MATQQPIDAIARVICTANVDKPNRSSDLFESEETSLPLFSLCPSSMFGGVCLSMKANGNIVNRQNMPYQNAVSRHPIEANED